VALALATLFLPSCFRPTVLSPDRPLRLWRAEASAASPRPAAGNPGNAEARPTTLTSEQAVRLALRQNPALQEARARERTASASVDEDSQLENPQLRIRDIEIESLAHSEARLDVALRVPIPQPWTRDARLQRARLRLEEARAERSNVERRLRADVRKLYARLAMLEQLSAQIERTIALFAQYRKLAEQRVQSGAATEVDASLPRLRHAEALDRRHALRLRRARVIARLRQLVGARPDGGTTFRTGTADLAPLRRGSALRQEALIKQALSQRRDLRRASARVGIAQADTYIARARRWPWLRFAEVSYNIRPDPDPLNWELYFALDIPLLSWNSGAIAAREARLERRRLEERAEVLRAVQEVSDAAARVRETTQRLREAKRSLLPALEAGSRAIAQAVELGVVDPLRATTVEWRRLRAHRRYLETRLAHREAVIDLEAALGGEQRAAARGASR
jgi:cobalt-zinc-cadmium efflux system outer membrane protein